MLDDVVQTKQMTELNLTTSHDVPERQINKGLEACEVVRFLLGIPFNLIAIRCH